MAWAKSELIYCLPGIQAVGVPMNSVVLVPSGDALLLQAAGQVRAGAEQAGGQASVLHPESKPDLAQFDLVFVGVSSYGLSTRMAALSFAAQFPSNTGRQYRIFCVHSGNGKKALEDARALLESKKAVVGASVLLECKGLLKLFARGSLSEGELARARAFGERGASSFLGAKERPANEKLRIPGYRK